MCLDKKNSPFSFSFIFVGTHLDGYKEILYTPLYKVDIPPDVGLSLFRFYAYVNSDILVTVENQRTDDKRTARRIQKQNESRP